MNEYDSGRFSSISRCDCPSSRTYTRAVRALVDAKGNWTNAHESAQQDEGRGGSWVHAYLHRKEGDQGNAAYWYGRAGKPVCREALDSEWLSIAKALLG